MVTVKKLEDQRHTHMQCMVGHIKLCGNHLYINLILERKSGIIKKRKVK